MINTKKTPISLNLLTPLGTAYSSKMITFMWYRYYVLLFHQQTHHAHQTISLVTGWYQPGSFYPVTSFYQIWILHRSAAKNNIIIHVMCTIVYLNKICFSLWKFKMVKKFSTLLRGEGLIKWVKYFKLFTKTTLHSINSKTSPSHSSPTHSKLTAL